MAKTSSLDTFRIDIEQVKKSKTWFNKQVATRLAGKVTPESVLTPGLHSTTKTSIVPGSLYFFKYDPKTKADLPYYDTFPMVFPFGETENGFIGLNFHYLGYQERFALLKALMHHTNTKITERAIMQYSWSTIKQFSELRIAQPCVKQYLYAHVRSPFCKVAAPDWSTAMLLPVERFVGQNKESVWRSTRR